MSTKSKPKTCACGKVTIPPRKDFVFMFEDRTTHWRDHPCVPGLPRAIGKGE